MKPRRFKVPVAHVNYDVVFSKTAPKAYGEPVQGYCDYANRKIAVHLTGNPECVKQTFLHEWTHALFYELGRSDLAQNEALVEGQSLSLARLLNDQPWLRG